MTPADVRRRIAAARGLAGARITSHTGMAVRTLHAEAGDRGGEVLVTLIVHVPGSTIDAALAGQEPEPEPTHG